MRGLKCGSMLRWTVLPLLVGVLLPFSTEGQVVASRRDLICTADGQSLTSGANASSGFIADRIPKQNLNEVRVGLTHHSSDFAIERQ